MFSSRASASAVFNARGYTSDRNSKSEKEIDQNGNKKNCTFSNGGKKRTNTRANDRSISLHLLSIGNCKSWNSKAIGFLLFCSFSFAFNLKVFCAFDWFQIYNETAPTQDKAWASQYLNVVMDFVGDVQRRHLIERRHLIIFNPYLLSPPFRRKRTHTHTQDTTHYQEKWLNWKACGAFLRYQPIEMGFAGLLSIKHINQVDPSYT